MGAIYLVRHGQAGAKPVAGDYDKLSETGMVQAQRAGQELARRGVAPTRIVTGTLERQRATAQYLAAAAGFTADHQADARWNEYDHRDILRRGGLSTLAASANLGWPPRLSMQGALEQALREWAAQAAPGRYRESFADFTARVGAALGEAAADPAATTVVVTSAGVVSAVVAELWGIGVDKWIDVQRVAANAGITTVVVGRRGVSLVAFNDHGHLLGDAGGGLHGGLLTYR